MIYLCTLYYIVLNVSMLYCIVLYYTVLCCVVLCCVVLYCVVLYCIILHYSQPYITLQTVLPTCVQEDLKAKDSKGRRQRNKFEQRRMREALAATADPTQMRAVLSYKGGEKRRETSRDRPTDLTALGKGWKTVPACVPVMMPVMASGCEEEQMTIVQPAAVAMRAAVSLVTIPPVPHCESFPDVSTCNIRVSLRL